MPTPSILVIDDSEEFRSILVTILLDAGMDVWDACCPHDAFQLLDREKFDLILCDLHMPFMVGDRSDEFETSYQVGIKTIQELQQLFPDIPVIALTATPESDIERIKQTLGAMMVVTKPSKIAGILAMVESIVDAQRSASLESCYLV